MRVNVGGVATVAALRFDSPVSEFLSPRDCPAALRSVGAGPAVVTLEGSQTATRVDVYPILYAPQFTDVAGYLGFSPDSVLAKDRVIQFHRSRGVVSFEFREPKHVAHVKVHFPLNGHGWTIVGSLWLRSGPLGPVEARKIRIDFGTTDTVLPPLFRATFAAAGLVTDDGRFHVKCRRRWEGLLGETVFELTIRTARDSFDVAVEWTDGPKVGRGDATFCPVSLVFAESDALTVGARVLGKYDVLLDGRNRLVEFRRRQLRLAAAVSQLRPVQARTFTSSRELKRDLYCESYPARMHLLFALPRTTGTPLRRLSALRTDLWWFQRRK